MKALRSLLFALAIATLVACGGSSSAPPAAPVTPPPAAAPEVSPAAQTPAAAIGQTVTFSNGGSGYVQAAAGPAGKHPALLVIQEFWGLDDWIKQNVARFAGHGYVALAVDLYRGRVTADPGEAHELMRGLPEDRAMEDMKAAYQWLASRPDVDPQRIGIVGWCMGGGYALAFAVAEPKLRAVAMNYGKLQTAPEKIDAIHASVLGNFAGADRGIAPDDVRAFGEKLRLSHKDEDIKIYDGAKHAFMNPNNKTGYDDVAAKDAWARIDAFFARTLGNR